MTVQFSKTPLEGAWFVEIEPNEDLRGFFTRTWCAREFAQHGLPSQLVQSSLSRNLRRGTVRGMHLQLPPSQEGKLVSCIRGRIYDAIVDLRPRSPTYLKHLGVELSAATHAALYIPPTVLHGFQSLEDDTEVFYQMTDFHAEQLAFGARWNDPAFCIRWPIERDITILPRDAAYSDFDRESYERYVRASAPGAR
jgi:dTDP-4-dehydrorhamnose 3,5-epimerase